MPRVYVTADERRCAAIARWVYGELRIRKMSQQVLAEHRGVSRQAMSEKLKSHRFDFEDFATFVELFNPSDEELRRLIRGK